MAINGFIIARVSPMCAVLSLKFKMLLKIINNLGAKNENNKKTKPNPIAIFMRLVFVYFFSNFFHSKKVRKTSINIKRYNIKVRYATEFSIYLILVFKYCIAISSFCSMAISTAFFAASKS